MILIHMYKSIVCNLTVFFIMDENLSSTGMKFCQVAARAQTPS
jgi:hypothetical protein